jgi:hypothetical protein
MEEREKVEVPLGKEDFSFLYPSHIYDHCRRSRVVVLVLTAVLPLCSFEPGAINAAWPSRAR